MVVLRTKFVRCGLAVALVGLGACTEEPSGDDGAGSTGAQSSSGAADDAPSVTTSGTATSGSDSTGAMDTTATTGGAEASTGSGNELCGITDADEVSFEVLNGGTALPKADAEVPLECGGQGSFMFSFAVGIYGVDTGGSEFVSFHVTMDVDGFNDVGPGGHFMDRDIELYVGCDDFDGGESPKYLNLVMPDPISDPAVLHGAAFTIDFVMLPGDADEQVFSAIGVLTAEDEGDWEWCFGGGSDGPGESSSGGSSSDGGSSSTG